VGVFSRAFWKMSSKTVKLTVDDFGTVQFQCSTNEEKVKRFTWTNDNKMSVQVRKFFPIYLDELISY
jgi:hypothetical protein